MHGLRVCTVNLCTCCVGAVQCSSAQKSILDDAGVVSQVLKQVVSAPKVLATVIGEVGRRRGFNSALQNVSGSLL